MVLPMSINALTIDQISHYRELARCAEDRASRMADRRSDFRALAKGWLALATALEYSEGPPNG